MSVNRIEEIRPSILESSRNEITKITNIHTHMLNENVYYQNTQ